MKNNNRNKSNMIISNLSRQLKFYRDNYDQDIELQRQKASLSYLLALTRKCMLISLREKLDSKRKSSGMIHWDDIDRILRNELRKTNGLLK